MAVTGKGSSPFNSGWFYTTTSPKGLERVVLVRKYIGENNDGVAYKAIWSDWFFNAPAGGGTTVTTSLGQLTLIGFNPNIIATNNTVVTTSLGVLTLTGFIPTVNTTNNIVRNNNKQKELDDYVNKCIKLGDRLLRIRKTIDEDCNISLITHKGEFILSSFETLKSIRIKEKLSYDGESDYDDSTPDLKPHQRGIF